MSGTASVSERPYWALRIAETGLLLTSLVGIGMFAWSLVDIIRIEASPAALGTSPVWAWPGIFVFFGSMIALQVVRTVLHRYRRDDGTPRGGERTAAAVTTSMLGDLPHAGEPAAGARDDAMDA